MIQRRREIIASAKKKNLGTSDFSLENLAVYQASDKTVTLPVYLFKTNMSFTILMDAQADYGYSENGELTLDFLKGGAITNQNFTNGLGLRRYRNLICCYLYDGGPYVISRNDYAAHKFFVRFDASKATNNLYAGLDTTVATRTRAYVQSDNPLYAGGNNNAFSTGNGYGTINQLMIYYRTLTDEEIAGYVNNNIIP